MDRCKLTLEDVEVLNAFLGYGDFERADIIVMMNEEGMGGRIKELGKKENYELQIGCRVNAFGTNSNYYIDRNDKKKGFWEPGGVLTDTKIGEYFNQQGHSFEREAPVRATTLQFMSRMVQSLEDKPNSWHRWFYNKPEDVDTFKKVTDFIRNGGLLCERSGIKTALVDWRPLPRFDQNEHSGKDGSGWPFDGGIVEQEYYNAFSFRNAKNLDEAHRVLRNKRIEYLRELLSKTKAPVMIFSGEKDFKVRHLLPLILSYNGKSPEFVKGFIQNTQKEIYRAQMEYGNRIAHIFVTDFFDNKAGIGLEGLKNLTAEVYEIINGIDVSHVNDSKSELLPSIKEQTALVSSEDDSLVISGPKGVTNMQMIPVVKTAVDEGDFDKLYRLKEKYPSVFNSTRAYIGTKREKKLEERRL